MRIIEPHNAKNRGMTPVILIPSGKQVTVSEYCKAWRTVCAMQPGIEVKGWEWYPIKAKDIPRELHKGMHDRIDQYLPYYDKGRKWRSNWQNQIRQAAWQLNYPRLIIDWLPPDLKTRFAHRVRQPGE